jgi:4-hydroxy-tetrahydrodipicolinate synthase
MRFANDKPTGVIPAAILPFHDDLSIDEASYRRHLRDLVAVRGISAVTVNAHASEVGSCTFDEQQRILEITVEEIGDRVPIVNGIYAEGSLEAARLAKMATQHGAGALLVFPPGPFTLGQSAEMVLTHFRYIADASPLPLIAFEYPLAGGQGYPLETLVRLADEIPTVRAIKDWCESVPLHETHIRLLQRRTHPVTVLSTHSRWLLSSLVLGCGGLLSGMGSVVSDLHVELFEAIERGDLRAAQAVNERLKPLADAFYTNPFVDMHNRMKNALVLLGRIPNAAVRPPLVRLEAAEIARIREALEAAGFDTRVPLEA